jgi:hypothetical protein
MGLEFNQQQNTIANDPAVVNPEIQTPDQNEPAILPDLENEVEEDVEPEEPAVVIQNLAFTPTDYTKRIKRK